MGCSLLPGQITAFSPDLHTFDISKGCATLGILCSCPRLVVYLGLRSHTCGARARNAVNSNNKRQPRLSTTTLRTSKPKSPPKISIIIKKQKHTTSATQSIEDVRFDAYSLPFTPRTSAGTWRSLSLCVCWVERQLEPDPTLTPPPLHLCVHLRV